MIDIDSVSISLHRSPFDYLAKNDSYFQVANDVYYSLVENGPLGTLFRMENTRFGPSKGGSNPKFAGYYDQTHFQHALNVATAAGILFCTGMQQNGEKPTKDEVCTVMWAGALHDFNKIVDSRYPDCLKEYEERFVELIGHLSPDLHNSIRHLILATEDGTDGAATEYPCNMNGNVLKLAIASLAAGDTLSTTGQDLQPDDIEAYRSILEKLRAKHGNKMLPEVQVLPIYDVPQTALVATIRNALLDWIRENGLLLHDSPRRVSWVGSHWNGDIASQLSLKVRETIQVPFVDVAERIKIHPGSGSIPIDWVNSYFPNRERILTIIEVKNKQLIFWSRDWGPKHLSQLCERAPCFHHTTKTNGEDTVRLDLPEDDGTPSGRQQRLQAQILLASCLLHNIKGDTKTSHPDPASWDFDNDGTNDDVEPKSRKFVAGILDVIDRETSEELLNELLDSCISELSNHIHPDSDDGLEDVVNRVIGHNSILPEPGSTASSCVICGTFSSTSLDAQKAEGIKPSGWLPRTVAIQSQKDDAKICTPCILDSTRRAQIIKDSLVKGTKKAQYLHVHRSDTAVEGDFLNLIREIDPKRVAKDGTGIALYARDKADEPFIPHDNHITVPIPACGSTEDQIRLLDHILRFCYDTGHKAQVTSLGGIPRIHPCMVHWQNAPSWVHDLRPRDWNGVWSDGMAAIRCDRVPAALQIVRAIKKAAYVNKVGKNVAYSPFINTLISYPLGLYRFPCNASKDEKEHPTTTLERYFMTNETIKLLENAGHAYCKFNTREASAWGKSNHWQWATRSVIRNLEKQSELAPISARGILMNDAQRKFEGAKDEDIDEFVSTIEELVHIHGKGNDQVARDIIVAVEWTAERVYHPNHCGENCKKCKKNEVSKND